MGAFLLACSFVFGDLLDTMGGSPRLKTSALQSAGCVQQVAERHLLYRLLKNGQMQGTRNSEE